MPAPIQAHLVAAGRFHDIDYARLELLKLLAEHPHIRTSVGCSYADTARLAECAMLVTYTCDVVPSGAEAEALAAFLARGGRWLALHGTNSVLDVGADGIVRTPAAPALAALLGTSFVAHPPIGPFEVRAAAPDHPLVRGLAPFRIVDELYLVEQHGPIEPLLTTRFGGPTPGFDPAERAEADVPVVYLRAAGAGAVLYNTLGHCRGHYDLAPLAPWWPHPDRCAWSYPVYHELLRRGIAWAAGHL